MPFFVMLATVFVSAGGRDRANPQVIHDWNTIMVSTVAGQNPFAQARSAAVMHLAVFEAVNSISPHYRSYLDSLPQAAGASAEAAAVAAAHGVLSAYVPANAASLDQSRVASLATIPDGPAKVAGIAAGEAAAAAMIANRAADGSTPPAFHMPASVEPGEWQPTPGCPPAGGVLLHWGGVTPFGVRSIAPFGSAPPPPLASRRYARDLNEVKAVGGAASTMRTEDRAEVARFYNLVLAVATWNPVVRELATRKRMSLADSARMYALLNMAMSDALVAVMDTKYRYRFWRPITAIHEAGADGNPRTDADASFAPYIPTPCFPSYGSAHAAASYAGRVIAERHFGEDFHALTLANALVPDVVLEYETFEEITDDIDDARVYGGIHFRFDQRAGASQGRRIGTWVYAHNLQQVRGRWKTE
jgi:hypothetical protein